ncbi:MAG: helix-turn-helix domain-containing protein [Candidatus Micrarchaeota archaeon]
MKQLFQKSNVSKVLAYFLKAPRSEVYLRELARTLGMSPSTALRSLSALEKEGLVARRTERHVSFFKANMGLRFKALKVAQTVSLFEKKRITKLVSENSQGFQSLLLYGSAANGEDDAESDYDLMLIASGTKVRPHELSEMLDREVNLQRYSISEWKEVSRKNRAFYLEVISNSIALKGEKPVID